MKNVLTIADIMFGKEFVNEKTQINTQLVNINTVEKLHQFKRNEDGEKEEVYKAQFPIHFSEFTRMLVLDQWLALMPNTKLTTEQQSLSKPERDKLVYADHIRCLKGAKLTISREEITEIVPDETKPKQTEDGEPVLEDGEQVYEPLLGEDGKPVKKVVGYKDMEIVKIELTPAASGLAQHLAFNKQV